MIENTLENKAKLFGLYAHQKVWGQHSYPKCLDWVDDVDYKDKFFNDACLLLKPLSSITDEDAKTVGELFHKTDMELSPDNPCKWDMQTMKEEIEDMQLVTPIADFLRSVGYLLSWMGLTPDELISRGWVKLKEG